MLWSNLIDVRRAPVDAQHFMGALVFQRFAKQTGMTVHHRIIDGQQRLITLSLVLAATKGRLADYPTTERRRQQLAQIDGLLLNMGDEISKRLKVLPYGDDRDAFVRCLALTPTEDTVIERAFAFFEAKLRRLNEKGLIELRDRMAGALYFAAVYLDDNDDANKIFQSLNEAGIRLSPTDHIRNNLFMAAGTSGDDLYKRHWEPLERLMGSSGALLEYLFAEQARQPHEPRALSKKELHQAYAERFRTEGRSRGRIRNFIIRLEEHGLALRSHL